MQIYKNRPDIFELVVGDSFLNAIEIKKIEYPFGPSKEDYCYFNNILIGMVSGDASLSRRYYEGLNIMHENHQVIRLTPILSKNEYLLCPKYEEFENNLQDLLDSTQGWTLICEADCDQNKVEENPELENMFQALSEFCTGVNYDCPTFVYRNEM
jgi:hypothetical protein